MALADINGYKAYWEDIKPPSDVFDETDYGEGVSYASGIPYRLLLPKGYNDPENATKKYPMMVWLHGSGECYLDGAVEEAKYNTSQVTTWTIAEGYNSTTQSYDDFEVIMLIPQFVGYSYFPKEGDYQDSFEYLYHSYRRDDMKSYALTDLVSKAVSGELEYYTDITFTAKDASASQLRVDLDRVYLSGSSMGAYMAYSIIRRARDVFAAIIPTHGGAGIIPMSDITEQGTFYINEFSKHRHIAKLMLSGTADTFYSDAQTANLIVRTHYPDTPVIHVTVNGMGHSIDATNNIFDKSLKFNPNDKTEQEYGYTGDGAICGMDWLLQQTKQEVPVDLFPENEETLWTDRKVLCTNETNKTQRLQQFFIPNDMTVLWKHLDEVQNLNLTIGDNYKQDDLMLKRVSSEQYRISNDHEYFIGV